MSTDVMKMGRAGLALSALAWAALLPTQAQAATPLDGSGWYVGGMLDYLVFDGEYKETDLPMAGDSLRFDGHAGGITLFGGYDVNRWFGVELHMRNGGDVSSSSEYDASISEIVVSPKFTWQLAPRVSVYGKAGLGVGSYTMEFDRPWYWEDDEFYWSGYVLSAGVGLQVGITDRLFLRGSYEYSEYHMEPTDDIAWNGSFYYRVPDVDAILRSTAVGVFYKF